jgi:hypothetical protein
MTVCRVKLYLLCLMDYAIGTSNCLLIDLASDGCTSVSLPRARLRAVSFLVRMCLLNAFLRLIFPVPVSLNRFFALDFVFDFGILLFYLKFNTILNLSARVGHHFFLGLMMMNILLPSNFGICSGKPYSINS